MVRLYCASHAHCFDRRSAVDELGLRPGIEVHLALKATALHVVPA